jgi:hypothetical protein
LALTSPTSGGFLVSNVRAQNKATESLFYHYYFYYLWLMARVVCSLSIVQEISIISETGAAIWSKLTLGLLASITPEVVRFRTYATFPALLPFLKYILEFVFCKGVQHRLNCVKVAAFQSWKQK